MNNKLLYLFASLLMITGFFACVDQEFDEPPVRDLPNLEGNTTIAELKALYPIPTNGDSRRIEEDIIIEAIVVGDDESGNFFRQIAVQDETGGILIRMNGNGLFGEYPVGRQIFIKAQGLYIGDFAGMPQINGSPEDPIEELLVPEVIIPGERDQPITPTLITISELDSDARLRELLATLVEIENVQFTDADSGVTFADAANRISINRNLQDCNGNVTIVRSSGFADFAADLTPSGNGNMVAVLSVFGDTRQLLLRDETDVAGLTGDRCGGGSTGGELMSIEDVRALYTGSTTNAPDDRKIRGVVISDASAGNITGRNMVVQDGEFGIVVRFENNPSFALGEEVEVTISGLEISEFNGLLQLNNVPNGNAVGLGAGTLPSPRVATVADILTNAEDWESTLVQIQEATISGGATISAANTVSDATGSVDVFTFNSANFANNPTPTGTVTITAIVSEFNETQISLRNGNDVQGGGGGVDPTDVTASELRTLFDDGAMAVPAGRKIRGIVTSDQGNGNTTDRNLVLQDASGGIVIRFSDPHSFTLGEDIEVNVSGLELSEFNGLLQVNNVPNGNANTFGPGMLPDPQVVTVDQILNNFEDFESTLVRINGVTISGGDGTYNSGNTALDVTDASGTIAMFTRSAASFAGNSYPTGEVDLIVIVSEFNAPQILIRNLSDVIE